MASFPDLLKRLRALAEPSRLRLLAILARGEFAVTELTVILGQSQPRISRHLKVLGEAGLLEKFREQHWIYYRVPAVGEGRELVNDLLGRLDPSDPVLQADAGRVAAALELRRQAASPDGVTGSEHARDELAAALAAELGDRGHGSMFYYGPAPAEVLGAIASRARRVTGMHSSRREVQRARAVLHSRGLSHCAMQQGELAALPQSAPEFDVAILDRAIATHPRPDEALADVARLLRPAGEILLVDDYDALASRARTGNPLAALRAWLTDAGLACVRLRPLDLDGRHVVLAVARLDPLISAAA